MLTGGDGSLHCVRHLILLQWARGRSDGHLCCGRWYEWCPASRCDPRSNLLMKPVIVRLCSPKFQQAHEISWGYWDLLMTAILFIVWFPCLGKHRTVDLQYSGRVVGSALHACFLCLTGTSVLYSVFDIGSLFVVCCSDNLGYCYLQGGLFVEQQQPGLIADSTLLLWQPSMSVFGWF